MPRRGYRFIAPVDSRGEPEMPAASDATFASCADAGLGTRRLGLFKAGSYSIVAVGLVLVAGTIFLIHNRQRDVRFPKPRALTRLTFDDGLQIGATWSPDGRFI